MCYQYDLTNKPFYKYMLKENLYLIKMLVEGFCFILLMISQYIWKMNNNINIDAGLFES